MRLSRFELRHTNGDVYHLNQVRPCDILDDVYVPVYCIGVYCIRVDLVCHIRKLTAQLFVYRLRIFYSIAFIGSTIHYYVREKLYDIMCSSYFQYFSSRALHKKATIRYFLRHRVQRGVRFSAYNLL